MIGAPSSYATPARAAALGELVLALDVGTSSVRCMAFDSQGAPVDRCVQQCAHEPRMTPDGGSELDALLLLEASLGCLEAVCAQVHARGGRVLGVGVCTFWHGVLAVDAGGAALTPVLLWNDTRSGAEALGLREHLDERALHQRTGCVLHPSYLPARLAWLRRTRPEVFRPGVRLLSFGEFLEQRLFGVCRCSLSMASGTGLLNRHTLDWDAEVLAALELTPAQLAPLEHDHRALSGLQQPYAERLPALANTLFYPALGDGACSNLGCGATARGDAALMIGSSAALRLFQADEIPVLGPAALLPQGLWHYRLDRERSLKGGALSNGGNLIAWLRRTLNLPPEAALDALLHRLALDHPAGHGLSVLPFLYGERNPDYPLGATALFAGLRGATTPEQIVQAAMEAVAYRLAAILERLRAAQPNVTAGHGLVRCIASGGLLRSPAWVRILTDVLGLPLARSTVAEASSRGAALMALEALGCVPAAHTLPPPLAETIYPDPERHALYAAARQAHEAEYAAAHERGLWDGACGVSAPGPGGR